MDISNDNFWSERYRKKQTGWDIGKASPPLTDYMEQWKNKEARILIPGCGNAYEAEFLVRAGFTDITLLDISEVLVNELKGKLKTHSVRLIHSDFFGHTDTYDLILEQTFFCALPPVLRQDYANKMYDLLAPGGTLAGLLFNRHFEGGPPFGGSMEEYESLFSQKFSIKTLETCHNSIAQRRGAEAFLILKKGAVDYD
jgi:methyl halide transferase